MRRKRNQTPIKRGGGRLANWWKGSRELTNRIQNRKGVGVDGRGEQYAVSYKARRWGKRTAEEERDS